MRIVRAGDVERSRGSNTRYEGRVEFEGLSPSSSDAGIGLAVGHFYDGARTHWHVHEQEQILYIISGECRLGTEEVREALLFPGDRVYLPGGERHWHGAAAGVNLMFLTITTGPGPAFDDPPPARD